ncbi:hypothetical protein MES5069_550134 [Mesorhizobium escarrei]|uniref:DUF3072 domain-containing protein n=1 Tax=Mesorhizobium escarrei TaxID=666018 RepID=A0ABM9ECR5_9HYPH|nr:hypothetical protein MES5069_550134 [Mesorhizobium escarrei]
MIMGDRHNPKIEAPANVEKDPEDWISGDDPMTPAQASYLKTLAEQADDPDAYADGLSKAEASKRIDALRGEVRPVVPACGSWSPATGAVPSNQAAALSSLLPWSGGLRCSVRRIG